MSDHGVGYCQFHKLLPLLIDDAKLYFLLLLSFLSLVSLLVSSGHRGLLIQYLTMENNMSQNILTHYTRVMNEVHFKKLILGRIKGFWLLGKFCHFCLF